MTINKKDINKIIIYSVGVVLAINSLYITEILLEAIYTVLTK